MIFHFPDFATLELALTNGDVPVDVSLKPVIGGVDDANRPWIEPSVKSPRGLPAQLAKLGVSTPRSYPSAGVELINWLQALPLRREEKIPELAKDASSTNSGGFCFDGRTRSTTT